MNDKTDQYFNRFCAEIESARYAPCPEKYPISEYDSKTQKILSEIDEQRNHPWIREIYMRNRGRLDYVAIKYRGHKITYKVFFAQAYRYAAAMKATGFQKGQTVICAIENTPEFPYIMGAISLLAGKVNLVCAEMDGEYLAEMLDRAECPYVFVSDMSMTAFAPVMHLIRSKKRIVLLPLDMSLAENPYQEEIDAYYSPDYLALAKAVQDVGGVIAAHDFLGNADGFDRNVLEESGLNDEYTITYTSGSTGWGRPKALIHRVRSYITMGRYHDPEVSGIPAMEETTTLALIKTMSDTDFMSGISDTFMQGGTVALEPINDVDFFLISILMNEPITVIASRSYWLHAMKQQQSQARFHRVQLPFLFAPIAVGEPLAANEERLLNQWLRKMKAGIKVTKLPFSVIRMSVAGGDSEHGGIFLSLFRSLHRRIRGPLGIKEPIGMKPYDMVEIKALREDGTYCSPMEAGLLVANSPCTMKGYAWNIEADKAFFIQDSKGKTWGSLGVYGYLDKKKRVYVKGRASKAETNTKIKNYMIQDIVLADIKNIRSCEVVNMLEDGKVLYIAHIELNDNPKTDNETTLINAAKRCMDMLGKESLASIYFRLHSQNEPFELLHTGKRSNIALIDEGLTDKCVCAMTALKQMEVRA